MYSFSQQLRAKQNAAFISSCSSSVCENAPEKSLTVSYLINSCGLSSNNAVSASKKLCFKSPEKPDAVLKLLREYGFTDAQDIPKLVTAWPNVLVACPNKTLLPKLQFFRSIGVPLPVLAQKLSIYPSVLQRSLENSIIPFYNYLRSILGSNERVVRVFSRAPMVFSSGWSDRVSSSISFLRERGVPESAIVSLIMSNPPFLIITKEKLASCIDRAVEIGFDVTESGFVQAMKVFLGMSESTLKRKMEVYRMCGWSESETMDVFLRYPYCLKFSEKKIKFNMGYFVNELGFKASDVARCPVLLSLSLDKRMEPRCLVARILTGKGLKYTSGVSVNKLLRLPEDTFLESYIVPYEKDVPELLDIYLGKIEPPPQWI
ncbi:hypothetical protein CASFOL_009982 [Castilleja foliolosa]|uniref:Mitochondrial transcription termination factor family protein n=1 Tax=Castilleja foliolosa TaxID=1961234 RepID=A0ABD3DRU0_9LAMI